MKPAFSFGEIREVEKRIIENDSFPSLILMENAGKNSYERIISAFPDIDDYEVYIMTGKGNNAGDGFVIARHLLIAGVNFTIVMASDESALTGDALVNFGLLQKENNNLFEIIPFQQLEKSYNKKAKIIFIDALLGSGIKGKLNTDFEDVINKINSLKEKNKKLKVISVDVPSGLMSGEQVNPIVNADFTITMGSLKTELLYGRGKECAGDILVVPIGISEEYTAKYNIYKKYAVTFEDVIGLFPRRKKSSYKYSNGKVLIIGGSTGLSGAVIMSSAAAMKSGAGAVISAIPDSISAHFSRKLTDIIKVILPSNDDGSISESSYSILSGRIKNSDAVLLGPGISLNGETGKFIFDIIKKCSKNMVIDADALTVLAGDVNVLINREFDSEIILTPHIGEFSRLSKISTAELVLNRFEAVRDFAKKYHVNVVMKSETTFSCLKNGEIYINTSGNEGLGVVGSGDVLSGILVSLLGQTGDVYKTLVCGNYLHGFCSDLYYQKFGNKQSASQHDFIKFIPKAITQFLD